MRILLDQNLSPRLIQKLADILPGLESVYDHDLTGASNPFIFEWARRSEFSAIVSADRGFVHLAELLGPPPQSHPDRTMRFSVQDNRTPSAS